MRSKLRSLAETRMRSLLRSSGVLENAVGAVGADVAADAAGAARTQNAERKTNKVVNTVRNAAMHRATSQGWRGLGGRQEDAGAARTHRGGKVCSDNPVPFLFCCRLRLFMSSTTIFTVRPATLRDAKAIAELHNAVAREAFASMVTDAIVPVVPLDRRQAYWREAIQYAEPQVYVALEEDRIVGFVGFDRSRDASTPPTMGEIWAIYAARTHWGKGVGLALWDAAREGLQDEGCTHVSIWLPLANERAMRFHELAGFKREMSSAKTVAMGGVKIEEIRCKRPL